jgi:Domain of unknown function (DUF6438)
MKNSILILLILVFVAACNKKVVEKVVQTPIEKPVEKPIVAEVKPPVEATPKVEIKLNIPEGIDSNLLVSLQRTSCFGKCPAFKIELFNDGKVLYNGIAFSKRKNKYEAFAEKSLISEIQQKALAIKYFEYSDKYPKGDIEITDLSSTISYIRIENTGKIIFNNYDAPRELIEFQRWLEKTLDALDWKEIKG